MHSYSKNFQKTYFIHFALFIVAYGMYFLLSAMPSLGFIKVGPPVVFTLFFGLEFLFDRWAWLVLCKIPALKIKNFRGTYEGTLRTESNTEYSAKIVITQTWSRMEIDFQSGSANSKSISAAIINDRLRQGHFELWYNYFTPGKNDGAGRLEAHYGTAMLEFAGDGHGLEGEYFTEQNRNSYGKLLLKKLS